MGEIETIEGDILNQIHSATVREMETIEGERDSEPYSTRVREIETSVRKRRKGHLEVPSGFILS